ncbi:MAG: organomercurial lyase [Actinomycetota bacterium]|nr:organomercurial lyase [Actinomycetota bacterium]
MPQNVPAFEFSDAAKQLRQFVYEHWCANGRGPNLRAVHEGTGLDRRTIVQGYKELQLGIICVVDQDSVNCNLLKFQPFSSFPSQVEVWIGGAFHSYAGCALESVAISKMPPFQGQELTLRSYCACCLEPIDLTATDGVVTAPDRVRVHISTTPWDWNNDDIVHQCDSMNYVLDADHAERYERITSRRGVLLTIEQTAMFVKATGDARMWDYDWAPATLNPPAVILGMKQLGVDVSAWTGERTPVPGT